MCIFFPSAKEQGSANFIQNHLHVKKDSSLFRPYTNIFFSYLDSFIAVEYHTLEISLGL